MLGVGGFWFWVFYWVLFCGWLFVELVNLFVAVVMFDCGGCLGVCVYLLFGLLGFVCWVFGLVSMIVVYVRVV